MADNKIDNIEIYNSKNYEEKLYTKLPLSEISNSFLYVYFIFFLTDFHIQVAGSIQTKEDRKIVTIDQNYDRLMLKIFYYNHKNQI